MADQLTTFLAGIAFGIMIGIFIGFTLLQYYKNKEEFETRQKERKQSEMKAYVNYVVGTKVEELKEELKCQCVSQSK